MPAFLQAFFFLRIEELVAGGVQGLAVIARIIVPAGELQQRGAVVEGDDLHLRRHVSAFLVFCLFHMLLFNWIKSCLFPIYPMR
ncbi:hypothetical protein GCWU000325_00600 [Alloprevotella tannerae ATCC 51259]|uniref:Uncharacterized protein n=1 Tax=Alloprevotella tannerae ATCC 51259 TaxID=626522 RepID=C9LEH4_9BACT|nr:hypothetical protein GCWU000325_00600 [Alloprevotella tannerae ATCC 51259]